MKIKVRAKLTAGTHPVHGPIVVGHIYEIEEREMADQLFDLVGENDDNQPPAGAKASVGKKKGR